MSANEPLEIDVHEAHRRVQQGQPLVDVRERDEYQEVHIPGATLIPMSELAQRIGELPEDEELVVHCRSGARSLRVVAYLRQQGRRAVNVDGGIQDWEAAGLPTERA